MHGLRDRLAFLAGCISSGMSSTHSREQVFVIVEDVRASLRPSSKERKSKTAEQRLLLRNTILDSRWRQLWKVHGVVEGKSAMHLER